MIGKGDVMAEELDLTEIRKDIDSVDAELVKLFEKRLSLTDKVAAYKFNTGKAVLDRSRENQKLSAINSQVVNKEFEHPVAELFTQIMSNSRKRQYALLEDNGCSLCKPYKIVDRIPRDNKKIVFQGVPGAYSHIAAKQFFNDSCEFYNVSSWREAMEEVKNNKADYAVLPMDNSTTGLIADVYDLLKEYDNYIVGEEYVKVDHCLIGIKGCSLSDIKTVYSHAQGLMQCDNYLSEHKEWESVSLANTAMAAKKVLEDNDKSQVAIASRLAAEIYGLDVIAENIVNYAFNTTRFVIVSKERVFSKNAGKMSILFETTNETGTLYNLLSHFIYNGLNMGKIESRPIEGKQWEFSFYVDFEGNITDKNVMYALHGIEEEAKYIKILGNC